MPVYLCQPGAGQDDAWRHGIQVFSSPCGIDDETAVPAAATTTTTTTPAALPSASSNNNNNITTGERDLVVGSWTFAEQEEQVHHHLQQQQPTAAGRGTRTSTAANTTTTAASANQPNHHRHNHSQMIRRVRHAELVLVDDVCISYGRYWLRLRWPGQKGGFAGYIAMNQLSEGNFKGMYRYFWKSRISFFGIR